MERQTQNDALVEPVFMQNAWESTARKNQHFSRKQLKILGNFIEVTLFSFFTSVSINSQKIRKNRKKIFRSSGDFPVRIVPNHDKRHLSGFRISRRIRGRDFHRNQ